MKTSIWVPDWLHDQATDTDPEIPFSEMVRDAILIALPVWAREADKSSIERRLRAKVRMLEADAARAQVQLPERRNRRKASARPSAVAGPAPDAPPAGRRPDGRKSQTTDAGSTGRAK